jgi:hypothetical protein
MNTLNENKIEIQKELTQKLKIIEYLNNQIDFFYTKEDSERTKHIIQYLNSDVIYLKRALKSNITEKYKETFENGKRAEKRFTEFCEKREIKYIKTDKATDIRYKTDFFIFKNNNKITVDVKAIKKDSRYSKSNSKIQWLEFQNIYGSKGTLYSDVDLIAFESENSFIIVNKKSLLKYAEELKKKAKIVYNINDALYNLYQRKNTKDLVMKVNIDDIIKNCDVKIWN